MPTLQQYAQSLLDCAVVTLDEADVPPCKSFLAPGPNPPLDDCCICQNGGEGQLWVSFLSSDPIQPFNGQPCGRQFTVTYRIGITRCAHTLNDAGEAPSADELDADAAKIYRDRALLLKAITCCWVEENDLDVGEWAVGRGNVESPQGGCLFQWVEVLLRTSECSTC